MDSSNIGTNRIVPIETIERGISSYSEIGNQIVPFSKTEPPFRIHYISWIFGMLLTFAALSSTLIVPWHNVLKEPIYTYEIFVY